MAKWLALLPLGLVALTASSSFAQQTPRDIIVSYPEGNPLTTFIREDLGAAYARLGLHMVMRPLPTARSIEDANNGDVDAEAARSAEIAPFYPNLRQVPVSVLDLEIRSITLHAPLTGAGWNSLKGHHVCTVLGDKAVETRVRDMKHETAHTFEGALRMLRAGRCDVALMYQFQWLDIERLHLGPVCPSSELVARIPLYHYVHRRHEDLIPRLAEALRSLRDEGATARSMAPIEREIEEAKARNSCLGSL